MTICSSAFSLISAQITVAQVRGGIHLILDNTCAMRVVETRVENTGFEDVPTSGGAWFVLVHVYRSLMLPATLSTAFLSL